MSGWRTITDAAHWDTLLQHIPNAHVLQSWAWGEFKSRWGWRAQRLALFDGDTARAAVQLLSRQTGPVTMLYAPKGPAARDTQAWLSAIDIAEQKARQMRALWLKIDGDPLHVDLLPAWRETLRTRGWCYSADQVQFRNTALSDLQPNEEALLAAMKPKWRYNIRLAEKRGVTIRHVPVIDGSDAEMLYTLYRETAARDGFAIRERAYYLDAWRAMRAEAFLAGHPDHPDAPLGAVALFKFNGRAYYFYGMSRAAGRDLMPNHLLQWHVMAWARQSGCHTYDWWGAPEQLNESDRMWGVYRFKEGFGAQFSEGLGAWDFAPSRLAYRVYTDVRPRIAGIMRRS
jgi:peptidoglycan pentaglycine glycine transferase (the first glycine)